MADDQRLICDSGSLIEGGKGIRFDIEYLGETVPAFAVRYRGKAYAYLNRCAHVPVELDWLEGEFFDYSGLYLVCSMHGASYAPQSGVCVAGPCKGARLIGIPLRERNGSLYLNQNRKDSHG
jgi:nitrite reductase/ring-hydroxylating ferredoxin subunit